MDAPFKFLSHVEFCKLSREGKASYLTAAIKELAKMTATLRPHLRAPRVPRGHGG